MNCKTRAGFTLLELLVVVIIIMMLVGIIIASVSGIKKKSLIKQAQTEVESLAVAIRAYHTAFGAWPATAGTDMAWTNNDNLALIQSLNQQGQNFYEVGAVTQSVCDPFKSRRPYRILISPDNNSVKVWSCGPDGIDNGGGGDDLEAHH